MRRGLLPLAVLLIVGALASQPAVAGPVRAHTAATTFLGTLKLHLPPGGRGKLWELILKVTASHGAVGSLDVRDPGSSSLPPGIRSIAVITPSHSGKGTATFHIFVAINNLAGGAAAAGISFENLKVYEYAPGQGGRGVGMLLEPKDCEAAISLGNYVDGLAKQVKVTENGRVADYGDDYTLEREGDANLQKSSNESVLDNTIRAQCPGRPGVETTAESPTALD